MLFVMTLNFFIKRCSSYKIRHLSIRHYIKNIYSSRF